MSGSSRRARVRRLVREIGDPPPCLAHYDAGDPECDGDPPCAWRSGCRIYREFCGARGLDPEVEKGLVSKRTLSNLVFDLMHEWTPTLGSDSARALRAWDRFLEAFTDALPIPIHPNESVAFPGDLYVATWKSGRKPGTFRAKMIRAKSARRGARWATPIVRYWPVFTAKVSPTIEIRTDLRNLVESEPRIHGLAERWRLKGPGGEKAHLGAAAVKVYPERIEDVARLVAGLLRSGEIRGVRLAGGQVQQERREG